MNPSLADLAVEIREALPEDGPALVAAIETIDTETDFLGEPGDRIPWADHAEQQLRTFREKESAVYYLALEAGEIIGFLGAYRGGFAGNRGTLFIAHIGIRTHRRGQRLGTLLFEAVEDWARARDLHRLELRVDEENERGLRLYRRRGFVEEGRLVACYRGSDGLRNHRWMGKLLADALPALPYVEPALPEPRRRSDGVLIRPVETADAAAVQTFERRQLGALKGIYLKSLDEVPADIAAIEAQLTGMLKRPKTLTLGAFDADGCMVAYAGLWPETFRRIAHEASCNVNALPEWWGSGIGRQMIARIEAFAREHGFLRLAAYVSANNRRGRCFAAAAGFSDEVVLRQYVVIDGKAMDRIRLVRFLPSPAEAGEGGEPEGRAG